MRQRCIPNGSEQQKKPRYVGCTISELFQDFQFFANWHENQIGFNQPDYELDKDILHPRNKLYSEDTCILVPKALNKFMTSTNAKRGMYPQGVWKGVNNSFRAGININGKSVALGSFLTVEEAYNAYKDAKTKLAKQWAERLKSMVVDPRVIIAMRNWNYSSYFED
jgi:hypothetical protein